MSRSTFELVLALHDIAEALGPDLELAPEVAKAAGMDPRFESPERLGVARLLQLARLLDEGRTTSAPDSHLQSLRHVYELARNTPPIADIDSDLSREAGMDGNYARLLMAARKLDTTNTKV